VVQLGIDRAGQTGDDRLALEKPSFGDSDVLRLRVHISTSATILQSKITSGERGVSAAYFLSARDYFLDMLKRISIQCDHYEQTKHTNKDTDYLSTGRGQFAPGRIAHVWRGFQYRSQAAS
jgi:hypothetical protein